MSNKTTLLLRHEQSEVTLVEKANFKFIIKQTLHEAKSNKQIIKLLFKNHTVSS